MYPRHGLGYISFIYEVNSNLADLNNDLTELIKVVKSPVTTGTLPVNRNLSVSATELNGYEIIDFQVYIIAWSGSTGHASMTANGLFAYAFYFDSSASNSGTYQTITVYKKV